MEPPPPWLEICADAPRSPFATCCAVPRSPAPRGEMPQPQRSSGSDHSRSHIGPSCGTSCRAAQPHGAQGTHTWGGLTKQLTEHGNMLGWRGMLSCTAWVRAPAPQHIDSCQPGSDLRSSTRTGADLSSIPPCPGCPPARDPARGCGLACLAWATGRRASRRSAGAGGGSTGGWANHAEQQYLPSSSSTEQEAPCISPAAAPARQLPPAPRRPVLPWLLSAPQAAHPPAPGSRCAR